MDDRYHRAARDGRTDLLKEAFTKELNQPDDDGMTPTLWAAYHGNLEALTLCCRRGGDYNKCDYTGNSCLHLTAQNGHLNCLSFLVKLGANPFALDNDYNSPLTVAGNRGHHDCVTYLDGVISKLKQSNQKRVKEKEDKAKKEADKRIKKYAKLQEKQLQKMQNYYKGTKRTLSTSSSSNDRLQKSSSTSVRNFSQTIRSDAPKSMFLTQKRSDMSNFVVTGNNRKEAKTLSGLPSSQVSNVMFMQAEGMAGLTPAEEKPAPGKRGAVQDLFRAPEDPEEEKERPPMWFGTKALRGNFNSASAMYSALNHLDENGFQNEDGDSVIPSASKPVLNPSKEDDSDHSTDEEEEEEEILDPIVSFLESLNLTEYAPLFREEKMDMEALMLCTSSDLKEMGISLGPRKKILEALVSKKAENESEFTSF